jgi:hypothetical protein
MFDRQFAFVAYCAVAWSLLAFAVPVGAEPGSVALPSKSNEATTASLETSWSEIVEDLVVNLIPENYSDDRHWGKTAKVSRGVRVRTKGGQVRLEQREKKVNHGFWRRVKVKLLDPEKTLQLEIRNVRVMEDQSTRFELSLKVRARCETQFAFWTYDVKGLNGSVESDVTVQSLADCSFRIETASKEGALLPEVAFAPQVHDLDLKLSDVDTRRVGIVGGWVADELGNVTRKAVEEVLQSQEPKILERIQKSIRKNEDRMQIDLNDWEKLLGHGEKKSAESPCPGR